MRRAQRSGGVLLVRRIGGVVLGTLLATLVAWSPPAVQSALAAGPLRVHADATYTVDPGDAVVHVATSYTVTNQKPNTATVIYFYRTLTLGIQPDARSVRAVDGIGPLDVRTTHHAGFTEVQLTLRANLYYHRSTRVTLRYELLGGKPRSSSPIRVGRAFVTFGVWTFGDRNEGTVVVRLPAGFDATVDGDAMTATHAASGTVLKAAPTAPDSFFAVVSGENPAAFDRHRLSLPGGAAIVVLSWPEDDRWDESVSQALEAGFPKLEELVGLAWPSTGDLTVRERSTPSLEGYAGRFFSEDQRIDVSEDLDPMTIIHEASHAWFDGGLFRDRWIYEGLAEEYAWRVQTQVGGKTDEDPTEPAANDPAALKLDGWVFPEVIRDEKTSATELYGYATSFWLAHLIVQAAGEEQMRAAFSAAEANRTAYPGDGPAETVAAADDWRRFLDLTEPPGQADPVAVTQAVIDDVLAGSGVAEMTARDQARAAYRQLLDAGDGWLPPWYVREPMGTWAFDDATSRMTAASVVLALRDQAIREAAAEGLAFEPSSLEHAYEDATDSLDAAADLAHTEIAAIEAIAGAREAVGAQPDLIAQIGLVGETPRTVYDAARAAFEAGDPDGAIAQAQVLEGVLTAASTRGQERLLMGGIVVVALGGLLAFMADRRRRAARRADLRPGGAALLALDARFAAPEASEGSGTLPDHPDAPLPPPGEAPPDADGGSGST
jgi:hypothetical protein